MCIHNFYYRFVRYELHLLYSGCSLFSTKFVHQLFYRAIALLDNSPNESQIAQNTINSGIPIGTFEKLREIASSEDRERWADPPFTRPPGSGQSRGFEGGGCHSHLARYIRRWRDSEHALIFFFKQRKALRTFFDQRELDLSHQEIKSACPPLQ